MLQAGDCAEDTSFNAKKHSYGQFVFINSIAKHLEHKLKKPVVKIGRIAGQLAKPRSCIYEDEQAKIFNYFGDIINSRLKTATHRQANPLRLIKGYLYSKQVACYLEQYFKKSNLSGNERVFTSHEMLLLHYEESLTKKLQNGVYNLSAHNLWIGERTKQTDGAHVFYASLIQNPIGIKVGNNTNLQELLQAIKKINPYNLKGKINIITRLGCNNVGFLTHAVKTLSKNKINYSLFADPMHGNNKTINDKKVRLVEDIEQELNGIISTLNTLGKELNGIHLEASLFAQQECAEKDTTNIKTSLCDPRLSAKQSFNLIDNVFK